MKRIGWFEPVYGKKEKQLVVQALDSNFLSEGPLSFQLEKKLSNLLGVKHVILTTSGTSALLLAMRGNQIINGLSDGYEVIVPDLTCVATANAVKWAGAEPILTDVENKRYTLNPQEVKKKLTKKTKVIITVPILGRNWNVNEIEEIAKENDLTIIEDAAGSLGSSGEHGYQGTIGKVGCFSLQANKIISCGQGGIIVTNDNEYNEVIRRIKDQGRLYKSEFVYPTTGYNLKFNDLLAAVVLGQLEKVDERKKLFVNQRKHYESLLSDVEEVRFPKVNYEQGEIPIWVDAIVKDSKGLSDFLTSKNISSRLGGWPPVHRNANYDIHGGDEDFPVSTFVSDNYLWLPNGPTISLEDIEIVVNEIKNFYRK